jgi:hypothetical protein
MEMTVTASLTENDDYSTNGAEEKSPTSYIPI